GTAMAVAQNTVFNLTSNSSGTFKFYSDAAGNNEIAQVTISNGQSTASFYYKDNTAGSWTLTATWASGGSDLGNTTLGFTVSSSTATIASTNPSSLTEANLSGATVTVDLTNATYNTSLSTSNFSLATAP